MEEYKTTFLSIVSSVWGSYIVLFLKMPKTWLITSSPRPPSCHKNKYINGTDWVTYGDIQVWLKTERTVSDEDLIELTVNVEELDKTFYVEKWINKRLKKLMKKKSVEIIDNTRMDICDHHAGIISWTDSQKEHILYGKRIRVGHIECQFYCDVTQRLIKMKTWVKKAENLINNKEKLYNILCSPGCHHSLLSP